jgi:hypothetical protein
MQIEQMVPFYHLTLTMNGTHAHCRSNLLGFALQMKKGGYLKNCRKMTSFLTTEFKLTPTPTSTTASKPKAGAEAKVGCSSLSVCLSLCLCLSPLATNARAAKERCHLLSYRCHLLSYRCHLLSYRCHHIWVETLKGKKAAAEPKQQAPFLIDGDAHAPGTVPVFHHGFCCVRVRVIGLRLLVRCAFSAEIYTRGCH